MGTIRTVDHVAIVVPSIADTVPLFCDGLGAEFLSGGDNDETGIRLVHLRLPGFKLELMQPLRPGSLLQRHLDERGPGFHHMTFFVDHLRTTVAHLERIGLPVTATDFSAKAWQEAFLSPRSTFGALFQFVETTRRWDERETHITLDDVLEGRVVWRQHIPCLRDDTSPIDRIPIHSPRESPHLVDRGPEDAGVPPLSFFRSRRQGEILTALLRDPTVEFPLSALAQRLGIPYSSVHREIDRAERSGLVVTRRFQNLRLVRANVDSPHHASLVELLLKPFGPPAGA